MTETRRGGPPEFLAGDPTDLRLQGRTNEASKEGGQTKWKT
jgi:hypothetical protein